MVARVGILFCLAVLTGLVLAQSPGNGVTDILAEDTKSVLMNWKMGNNTSSDDLVNCFTWLGGNCTDECDVINSECIENKCRCKEDYKPDNLYTCIKTCTRDSNCTDAPNLVCSSGKCGCPAGTHIAIGEECLPLPVSTEVGSPCQESPQCTLTWGDLATCRNGTCTCQDEAILYKDACYYKIPLVGGRCVSDSKQLCYLEDDGDDQNAYCLLGTCICKSRLTATLDNRRCICQADANCSYNHLVCRNGKCVCPEDTHVTVEDDCLPISTKFGSSCSTGPQCTNKWGDLATCKYWECSCQEGTIFDTDACYMKVSLLDEKCSTHNQRCYLEADGDKQNVECAEDVCRCKEGYTATEDKKNCRDSGDAGALHLISISCLLLVVLVKIAV